MVSNTIYIDDIILETEMLMFPLISGLPVFAAHASQPLTNSNVLELACTDFYQLMITFLEILQSGWQIDSSFK